jgi:hypothetical protein
MSADQRKQNGIRRGALIQYDINIFIKQKGKFEKITGVKGPIRKI